MQLSCYAASVLFCCCPFVNDRSKRMLGFYHALPSSLPPCLPPSLLYSLSHTPDSQHIQHITSLSIYLPPPLCNVIISFHIKSISYHNICPSLFRRHNFFRLPFILPSLVPVTSYCFFLFLFSPAKFVSAYLYLHPSLSLSLSL